MKHLNSCALLWICLGISFLHRSPEPVRALVGPLSSEQQDWLETTPGLQAALAEIAGKTTWSRQQQADAIFDLFTAGGDPLLSGMDMSREVAILKVLHSDWSLGRIVFTAAWNLIKGQSHEILDLAGLVPGFGEGADLINGIFYWLEGDKANAAFSFAAMVPFVGWTSTGAKYAGKIIKTTIGRTAELKFIVDSNGLITFGNSGQLATVIGKKANHQAHHLIPWSQNNHEIVQRAADSGNWHPNLAINGINLDRTIHNGYDQAHRIYNIKIESTLDNILENFGGSISPQEAAQVLEDLAKDISSQLHLGKKLDEIVL